MNWFWLPLLVIGVLPAIYLGVLALAAKCGRHRPPAATRKRRIAIVVPAYNEQQLISGTVENLRKQNYPAERFAVWVIADNCTDDTAALARAAGAEVWERQGEPGKGQALHAFFTRLIQQDWDAVLVVDADSRLHPQALAVCNDHLESGALALLLRSGVLNPDVNWRTRMLEWSLASFNALRPCGKMSLGISAGITGNGFCLARQTLERVPYLASSIVEDIEYHLMLLEADIKVEFSDQAWVKSHMPTGQQAANTQRVRWERGRWQIIKAHFIPLLRAWAGGQRRAFDGLLDLLPPVSLVVLALCIGLLGTPAQRLLSGIGFLSIVYHYIEAARHYGNLSSVPSIAIHLPYYILQKTWAVLASFIRRRQMSWQRTERD